MDKKSGKSIIAKNHYFDFYQILYLLYSDYQVCLPGPDFSYVVFYMGRKD